MLGQTSILIVALDNWPAIARLPKTLKDVGFRVAAITPKDSFLSKTKYVDELTELPMPVQGKEAVETFSRVLRTLEPEVIVFGDDFTANFMWSVAQCDASWLAERGFDERGLQLLNEALGGAKHRDTLRQKTLVNDLAKSLRLKVPEFIRLQKLDESVEFAEKVGYPVILKPETSVSGIGVGVIRSKEELLATLPLVERYKAHNSNIPYYVQKFVEGDVAMYPFVSYQGKVLAGFGVLHEEAHPALTGAASVVRPVENKDMVKAVEKFVAATGFSGFGSMDFVLDNEGNAHMLELNPRPVPLSHLGAVYGTDLSRALHNKLTGARKRGSKPKEEINVVALYPQEMIRNSESDIFKNAFHDQPYDDPELFASYEKLISDIEKAA